MSTIAIFGGNGYAGTAIAAEAEQRGHDVLVVSRSGQPARDGASDFAVRGDIHDADSVEQIVGRSDVVIVSIPGFPIDGKVLADAIPGVLEAAQRHGTRVGVVGGSGTLLVGEGGPRLMDTEGFPPPAMPSSKGMAAVLEVLTGSEDGEWFYVSPPLAFGKHVPQPRVGAYLSGGEVLQTDSQGQSRLSADDLAIAVLDEIEQPKHENTRFSVIGDY